MCGGGLIERGLIQNLGLEGRGLLERGLNREGELTKAFTVVAQKAMKPLVFISKKYIFGVYKYSKFFIFLDFSKYAVSDPRHIQIEVPPEMCT